MLQKILIGKNNILQHCLSDSATKAGSDNTCNIVLSQYQEHQNELHSPREIISMICKTGQDALRKLKPCRKLFIHISNKSASNKLKNVSMESSKLLCLNGTSFCSRSCKLKTFPLSIASMLTFVMDGPRL